MPSTAHGTRRGRFIKYDKQKVLDQIVRGRMSAQEIADEHGITRDMVYSLKHAAKKMKIINEPVARVADLHTPPEHDPTAAGQIYQVAKKFRAGDIDDLDFYQNVQQIIA